MENIILIRISKYTFLKLTLIALVLMLNQVLKAYDGDADGQGIIETNVSGLSGNIGPSGSYSISFEINVAKGRNNFQPNVSLSYDSNGGKGNVGLGWNLLSGGAITRSGKRGGVPEYTLQDEYYLNGEKLLCQTVDGNGKCSWNGGTEVEFKTKFASFKKIILSKGGQGAIHWIVTATNGVKTYYGADETISSTDKKVRAEAGTVFTVNCGGGSNQCYKSHTWKVYKIIDTQKDSSGNPTNIIKYTYTQNQNTQASNYEPGGDSYITQIVYPGGLVEFTRIPRSDIWSSARSGGLVLTDKIFASVTVKTERIVNEQSEYHTISKFKFNHANSSYTNRTMLESITVLGADEDINQPLYTVSYEYNDDGTSIGWGNKVDEWQPPTPFINDNNARDDLGVRYMDLNGDSLTDIISRRGKQDQNGEAKKIWLNTSNGYMELPDGNVWISPISFANVGTRPADVNGDGRVDLIQANPHGNYTFLNVGTGPVTDSAWQQTPSWSLPAEIKFLNSYTPDRIRNQGVLLIDMDGDGLPDIIKSVLYTPNPSDSANKFYKNIGSGWQKIPNSPFILPIPIARGYGPEAPDILGNGVNLVDVNGDGLPDVVQAKLDNHPDTSEHGSIKRTYINTGNGFVEDSNWAIPTWTSQAQNDYYIERIQKGSQKEDGLRLVDLNGDGLPEIVRRMENNLDVICWNNGNGWNDPCQVDQYNEPSNPSARIPWALPYHVDFISDDRKDRGARFEDVNGDGLTDVVRLLKGDGTSFAYLNQMPIDYDKLVKINNPFGGYTTIEYEQNVEASLDPANNYISERGANPVVVKKITSYHSDRGNPDKANIQTYEFSGFKTAVIKADERPEGLGFNSVTTMNGEADCEFCTKINKYYFQEDIECTVGTNCQNAKPYDLRGKLRLVETIGRSRNQQGNGKITDVVVKFTVVANRYAVDQVLDGTGNNPLWVKLTEVDTHIFGNNKLEDFDNCREEGKVPQAYQTKISYEYDQYGNTTVVTEHGDVTIGGDERKTETQYYYEPDLYIVNLPATVLVSQYSTGDYQYHPKRKTTFDYDNGSITEGNVRKIHKFRDGNSASNFYETSSQYDDYGNLIWQQNSFSKLGYPLQNEQYLITKTEMDSSSNWVLPRLAIEVFGADDEVQGSDPEPDRKTIFTYDALNRLIKTVDPNGYTTEQAYDNFSRVVKTFDSLTTSSKPSSKTEYVDFNSTERKHSQSCTRADNSSEICSITYFDGLGRAIQNKSTLKSGVYLTHDTYYDEVGRVYKTSVPYGTTTADFGGRDWNQKYTETDFDGLNRPMVITHPDGSIFENWYYKTARTTRDALQNLVSTNHDAYGNPIAIVEYGNADPDQNDPDYQENATTTYEYDLVHEKPTKITDADGHVTTMTYDWLGNIKQLNDPDRGVITYNEYDGLGNLKQVTDAKGVVKNFTYDQPGRLTTADNGNSEYSVYEYDEATPNSDAPLGRVTSIKVGGDVTGGNAWYRENFDYDIRGRTKNHQVSIDGEQKTMSYTYDLMDRVLTETYPDGEVVNSSYEGVNLKSVIGNDTYVSNIEYLNNGAIASVADGNGVSTTYNYYDTDAEVDPISGSSYSYRIKDISIRNGFSRRPFQYTGYQYDKVGNIKVKQDLIHDQFTETYDYDAVYRLIAASSNSYGTKHFNYDQIGNILEKDGVPYYYDSNKPHAVTRVGDTNTYTYDANGNMVNKESSRVLVAPLNGGMKSTVLTNGTGYILYSEKLTHQRFGSKLLPKNSAHFVLVQLNGKSWKFDNGQGNAERFSPESTDVLVAEVNLDTNVVTDLKGVAALYAGIQKGYAEGNLIFKANHFNGVPSTDDFDIEGTYFVKNTTPVNYPSVGIIMPTSAFINNNDVIAMVSDEKISKVEFYVDKVLKQTFTTPAPEYRFKFDSRDYSNGEQVTIAVIAYDTLGYRGKDSQIYTIDKVFPKISWVSPTNNSTVSDIVPLTVNVKDNSGEAITVGILLEWNSICYISSIPSGTQSSCDWHTLGGNQNEPIPNGTYTLHAFASDGANNFQGANPITITVNNN